MLIRALYYDQLFGYLMDLLLIRDILELHIRLEQLSTLLKKNLLELSCTFLKRNIQTAMILTWYKDIARSFYL